MYVKSKGSMSDRAFRAAQHSPRWGRRGLCRSLQKGPYIKVYIILSVLLCFLYFDLLRIGYKTIYFMLSVDLLSDRIIHTCKVSLDAGYIHDVSVTVAVEVRVILYAIELTFVKRRDTVGIGETAEVRKAAL